MRRGGRGLLGAALLGAGVLIVASRIGVFGALPAFVWVVILFVVGAAVWSGAAGRLPMWQRIVAFSALAVLAMVTAGRFAGVAALGFPAMAFLLVYGGRRRSWWALIPGGMLASIALFIAAATLFPRWEAGAPDVPGVLGHVHAAVRAPRRTRRPALGAHPRPGVDRPHGAGEQRRKRPEVAAAHAADLRRAGHGAGLGAGVVGRAEARQRRAACPRPPGPTSPRGDITAGRPHHARRQPLRRAPAAGSIAASPSSSCSAYSSRVLALSCDP